MATADQVINLHFKNPQMTARQIAMQLSCHPGYVRATGQRRGLSFPKEERAKKSKSNPRKYCRNGEGFGDEVFRLTAKEELVELFYEFFDDILAHRACFEATISSADEFEAAMRAGQDITGFLMGDPFPGRSKAA